MTTTLLAAMVVLTAACADDGPSSTPPAPSAPTPPAADVVEVVDTVEVVAIDNTFRPDVVEVVVGTEVVFVNRGRNEHDALSVDGEGWGVHVDDFVPGDEYRHVFTEPGEYRYYCSIHGMSEVGMIGTVVVTGA